MIFKYCILSFCFLSSLLFADSAIKIAEPEAKNEITAPAKPKHTRHRLRKIVVIPFRLNRIKVKVLNQTFKSRELSRQLNQKIITELTQSRRFNVIDKEYLGDYLTEMDSKVPNDAMLRAGKALGVDYFLLGTMTEFKVTQRQTKIALLEQPISSTKATLNVDFRIIAMPTRQIKWSDSVKITANNRDLKKAKRTGAQGIIDYLIEQTAQEIVHRSLDNIYPIKILKAAGRRAIYLNQGGKMTAVGQRYEVYSQAEKIIDDDTGLNIKIDGEQVATIQITKVQAKYSVAKLIRGKLKEIKKGGIVRLIEGTQKGHKKPQKTMELNW